MIYVVTRRMVVEASDLDKALDATRPRPSVIYDPVTVDVHVQKMQGAWTTADAIRRIGELDGDLE